MALAGARWELQNQGNFFHFRDLYRDNLLRPQKAVVSSAVWPHCCWASASQAPPEPWLPLPQKEHSPGQLLGTSSSRNCGQGVRPRVVHFQPSWGSQGLQGTLIHERAIMADVPGEDRCKTIRGGYAVEEVGNISKVSPGSRREVLFKQ